MDQMRAGDAIGARPSTLPEPGERGGQQAFLPVGEVKPAHMWGLTLHANWDNVLDRVVYRHTTTVVCRMHLPVGSAR